MALAIVAIEDAKYPSYEGQDKEVLLEIIKKGFSVTGTAGHKFIVVLGSDEQDYANLQKVLNEALMAQAAWNA